MVVQESPVVRRVGVGPLHQGAHALELVFTERRGREPLGPLQLLEPGEGGLALDPLMQRKQNCTNKPLVHGSTFRAWWSSSRACSTVSAQSNPRARRTRASRSQG